MRLNFRSGLIRASLFKKSGLRLGGRVYMNIFQAVGPKVSTSSVK